MKGKLLAFSWIISVLIIWVITAFAVAQFPGGDFMQNLTNIWIIMFALIMGTFAGICVYCQASNA